MTAFPSGILNVSSYRLLASMVSEERSAVDLIEDLLHEFSSHDASKVLCLSAA